MGKIGRICEMELIDVGGVRMDVCKMPPDTKPAEKTVAVDTDCTKNTAAPKQVAPKLFGDVKVVSEGVKVKPKVDDCKTK